MTEFNCFRCGYKTKARSSMKNHFNRQKKCELKLEYIKYNEEQIFKLSFIPYKDAINIVFDKNINDNEKIKEKKDITNISHEKNNISENKIYKTNKEILDVFKNIHNKSLKKCLFCNKEFNKLKDLKTHILSICPNIEIVDENDSKNIINNQIVYNNNDIHNNTHNTQNNNNIIINVFDPNGVKKNVISFNENWDVSHIDNEAKLRLYLSAVKYTKVLEYILKNTANLNVLIDKQSDSGFVYGNEKIEKIKLSEIIEQSIIKVHKHLQDFSDEILQNDELNINKEILANELKITEKKFEDFYKDENIKKNVENYFSDIYSKHDLATKNNFMGLIDNGTTSEEIGF